MAKSGFLEAVVVLMCDYMPGLDEKIDIFKANAQEAFTRISNPFAFSYVYQRLGRIRHELSEDDLVLYTISHIINRDDFYYKSLQEGGLLRIISSQFPIIFSKKQ